jgi:hypothetical protein
MVKLTFRSKDLSTMLNPEKNSIIENKNLPNGIIGLSDKIIQELNIPMRDSGVADEDIKLYLQTPEGYIYELNSSCVARGEDNIEIDSDKYKELSSKIKNLNDLKIYNKRYSF